MNRDELVVKAIEIAEEKGTKFTKGEMTVAVKSILEAMVEGLKSEGKVSIQSYLTIAEKEVAERECLADPRHPELGKKVVPAHKGVSVKVGSAFKNAVK